MTNIVDASTRGISRHNYLVRHCSQLVAESRCPILVAFSATEWKFSPVSAMPPLADPSALRNPSARPELHTHTVRDEPPGLRH